MREAQPLASITLAPTDSTYIHTLLRPRSPRPRFQTFPDLNTPNIAQPNGRGSQAQAPPRPPSANLERHLPIDTESASLSQGSSGSGEAHPTCSGHEEGEGQEVDNV